MRRTVVLCLAHIAAGKITDVGVAGRHSTGDATRLPDRRCAQSASSIYEGTSSSRVWPCAKLGVLARSNRRLRPSECLLWLLLRWWWPRWREALVLVQPATVDRRSKPAASASAASVSLAYARRATAGTRDPRGRYGACAAVVDNGPARNCGRLRAACLVVTISLRAPRRASAPCCHPVRACPISSRAICVSRLSAISSSASDLRQQLRHVGQTDLTGQRARRAVGGDLVVLHLLGRGDQRRDPPRRRPFPRLPR